MTIEKTQTDQKKYRRSMCFRMMAQQFIDLKFKVHLNAMYEAEIYFGE